MKVQRVNRYKDLRTDSGMWSVLVVVVTNDIVTITWNSEIFQKGFLGNQRPKPKRNESKKSQPTKVPDVFVGIGSKMEEAGDGFLSLNDRKGGRNKREGKA